MVLNSDLNFAIIVLILFLQLLLFYKVVKYKNILDKKNVQLIQFHLDTKFMCRSLIESLSISNSSKFCNLTIKRIKEYFNLEDLFIIDSLNMIDGENNTKARSEIIKFMKDNVAEITNALRDHKLTKINIDNERLRYVLYVSRFMEKNEGDGFIVCAESKPSLLNENEKASLENCINLLKTRLIYE